MTISFLSKLLYNLKYNSVQMKLIIILLLYLSMNCNATPFLSSYCHKSPLTHTIRMIYFPKERVQL